MPDPESDPASGVEPVETRMVRRLRARNLVMAVVLVLWVVAIYVSVMVRIDHDIMSNLPHATTAE